MPKTLPKSVQKAIQSYLSDGFDLSLFHGTRTRGYAVLLSRSVVLDESLERDREQVELFVRGAIVKETRRSMSCDRQHSDGSITTVDKWDLSGQRLREFLRPTGSRLTQVPRNIPYYGTTDAAIASWSVQQLQEFLALAPHVPGKSDAGLYLDLIANLTDARRKTVQSIHWQSASAQTRRDVWRQLLQLESMIVHNIVQFGSWWNRFQQQFDACPVIYPIPSHLEPYPLIADRYQASKESRLYEANMTLDRLKTSLEETLRVYRGEEPQDYTD